MIIDCHIHAGLIGDHYPKWWIDELYRHWGGIASWNYSRPNMTVGERLLHQMNELGLDMMCIMTSDHRRVYPHELGPYTPNDFLLEVQSVAPERFALTCSVDPLRDIYESSKEIERCIKLGFRACKIYPTYDHFDPRDERLFPIYEKLIELDTPMQVHMGWTPCLNAPMKYQQPYLLDDVAARYPELKIVISHMGWPWVDECMALIAKWENLHADIAYWGWFPPEKVLANLTQFGQLCGFHKLLFGSENSHTHMASTMMLNINKVADKIGVDPISAADLDKIMWQNAARIWKIDVAKLKKQSAERKQLAKN
jgi:predicted TIM-barrel fold metal-dependent hydrolase